MSFIKCLLVVFLVLVLSKFSASFQTSVNVNDSTALSCYVSCSDVIQWKRNGVMVAECGAGAKARLNFTCTTKEDKTILNISLVSDSSRGFYSAFCNGREVFDCRQSLKVIFPETAYELGAGDDLQLDLHNFKSPIITYTEPGSNTSVELCRVESSCLKCLSSEYQERAYTFRNVFKLTDVQPPDSGKYTVQEKDDSLVSSSYVTVKDRTAKDVQPGEYWQGFILGAVCIGITMLFVGGILDRFLVPRLVYHIRKLFRRLRKQNETTEKEHQDVPLNEVRHGNME